jgi:hypothetical protein
VSLATRAGRANDTAFGGSWAESRFVEIKAMSADFARQIAERRYPEDQGVDVEGIDEA